MTDLLYLRDAQLRTFTSKVTTVDEDAHRIELDATAFYVQGGGQPYDTGVLSWDDASARVTSVTKRATPYGTRSRVRCRSRASL